jgi:hypothetical protein
MIKWMRTCQSCFVKQEDAKPEYGTNLSDSYMDRKCRTCGSRDFDYGCEFKVEDHLENLLDKE